MPEAVAERDGEPAEALPSIFPVESFREAAPHLRRPFDLHAVKFRALEGSGGKRLNCAAYITARTVVDRLNLVCPHLWRDDYEPVPGGLRCVLTIDGLPRSDVGWSSGTGSAMGLKALYSDAFKRAAVKFGVGVSLYALPRLVLLVEAGGAWAKAVQGKTDRYGNQFYSYGITPQGMNTLRGQYELWLAGAGESFGAPLAHGHVEGSEDPEDETQATGETDPPAMATEGDIKLLKEAAKGLVFKQVKMCFAVVGLPVPEYARSCWDGVGRDAVAPLAKELKGTPRKPKDDA